MIFDQNETTTTVFQVGVSIETFLENFKNNYEKCKDANVIINLGAFAELKAEDVLKFSDVSNAHRELKKSFVVVTPKVSYDDVPEELCVVPTIQEANDIIEMEEIERDLGF